MEPCTTPYPFYTPRSRATTSQPSPSTSTSRHPPVELNSPSDAYAEQQAQFDAHARRSPSSRDGGLLGCLYPGATFVGTQRSGQFAYEVTVTLATVSASPEAHLCGYLKIKGLTDEHPELTTYFDSELIMPGNEDEMAATSEPAPSFRTPRTWGASEARDWQHWSRFPAFQNMGITDLDQRPSDDSLDGDSGAVFMRWKERFLVPDHRVKDINGASFAGFYYVCVQAPGAAASSSSSSSSAQARRARRRSTQSTTFYPSSPIGTSPSTPSTTTTAVPDDDDEQPDATAHKSFSDPDGDAPVPDTDSLFGHSERHAPTTSTDDVPSFVSSPNSLALGPRSLHHEEDIYVPPSPSHHTLSPPDVHLAMPSASATPLHSDEPLPASSLPLAPSPAPPQQHSSEPRPIPMPADLLAQPYSSYLSSSSPAQTHVHHEPEPEFDFDADVDAEDDDLPPPGTGALMYGYYFHPHSDPFQKLTLRHVPELDQPGSAFAFR